MLWLTSNDWLASMNAGAFRMCTAHTIYGVETLFNTLRVVFGEFFQNMKGIVQFTGNLLHLALIFFTNNVEFCHLTEKNSSSQPVDVFKKAQEKPSPGSFFLPGAICS